MAVVLPLMHLVYGPAFFAGDAPLIMGPAHFLVSYVLPAIAVMLFSIYREATPGKIATRARIVDARSGAHPSTSQFVIRYLGYILSSSPLCLGLIWVAIDRRKQGWRDEIAGTVVVRERRATDAVRFDDGDTRPSKNHDNAHWHA
jgi:uncharacterized RDD family membrane protein YckC